MFKSILAVIVMSLSVNAMAVECKLDNSNVTFQLDVKPWGEITVNDTVYNINRQVNQLNNPQTLETYWQFSSEVSNGDFAEVEQSATKTSGYLFINHHYMPYTCAK